MTRDEILRRFDDLIREADSVQWNTSTPAAGGATGEIEQSDTETGQNVQAKKLGKSDVDAMSDGDVLYHAFVGKDRDTFDSSGESAIDQRVNGVLQKSRTGTLTDKDRQDIIGAIVRNAKSE